MSFGMEIADEHGNVIYSSLDSTWNYMGSAIVPANTTGTFYDVLTMSEHKVIRQMVNQLSSDDEAYIHRYSFSGTNLVVTAPSSTDTTATLITLLGR